MNLEVYPQIAKSVISQSGSLPPLAKSLISQLPSVRGISATEKGATPGLPPEVLLSSLSFTHFVELLKVEEPLKRSFYEIECVRGTWSVRELKRQIASLYYERSGLSHDKTQLAAMVQARVEHGTPALPVRDPYVSKYHVELLDEAQMRAFLEAQLQERLPGEVDKPDKSAAGSGNKS